MQIKTLLFSFVLLLSISNVSSANDSIGAIGAGGIEFTKTKDISMEKEILSIYADRVRVEYEFINRSSRLIKERILFPMPFYSFDPGCSPTYTGDLQLFRVWVNGEETETEKVVRARLSGKDVTSELKQAGFDDEDIATFGGIKYYCGAIGYKPEVPEKFSQSMKSLAKLGLISRPSEGGDAMPLWQASNVYYWDQEFPPHKRISVVHEYVPFVGTGQGWFSLLVGDKFSKEKENTGFCIDKGTFAAAQMLNKRGPETPFLSEGAKVTVVDYVLSTGANWSGPIKYFTLNLIKTSPTDVVSLCFDGKFHKEDDVTLTSKVWNFLPAKDISVLFISHQVDEAKLATTQIYSKNTPSITAPEMVSVPSGEVDINPPGNNRIRKTVSVQSFEIGKFEVTQGLWKSVMGNNPSKFKTCGDNCPVEQVSWNDVLEFLGKLNQKTGKQFRLPTNIEWQYACFGGNSIGQAGEVGFCNSDFFPQVAWLLYNSDGQTHPVGQKKPNGYGLYDMSGNVSEWMQDCWSNDCGNATKYSIRGGSWQADPNFATVRSVLTIPASTKSDTLGFRLARTIYSDQKNISAISHSEPNAGDTASDYKIKTYSSDKELSANEMPELAKQLNCSACHAINSRVIGPAWVDVAKKYLHAETFEYGGKQYALEEGLLLKVSKGGSGHWGLLPEPALDPLGQRQSEIRELIKYILALAK